MQWDTVPCIRTFQRESHSIVSQQSASEAEFLELVERMTGQIERLATAYAQTEDRDDLIQEIRLQLWKSWSSFRSDAKPTTWAYRVILNTALMYKRHRKRKPIVTIDTAQNQVGGATYPTERAILSEFLTSLRPVDRAVFVLFLEGVARDEMAEILGLTASAIASRLNRMKSTFRGEYVEVDE